MAAVRPPLSLPANNYSLRLCGAPHKRRNWPHIAGDGGLKSAAVLLSVAASAKRHQVNDWTYAKHLLTEMPARKPGDDLTDLLPDMWLSSYSRAVSCTRRIADGHCVG